MIPSRCLSFFFPQLLSPSKSFWCKDTSHPQNRMMTGASVTVLLIFPDSQHLPSGIPQVKQMEGGEEAYQKDQHATCLDILCERFFKN